MKISNVQGESRIVLRVNGVVGKRVGLDDLLGVSDLDCTKGGFRGDEL